MDYTIIAYSNHHHTCIDKMSKIQWFNNAL